MKRYALVSARSTSPNTIERYLPGNYRSLGIVELSDETIDMVGPHNMMAGTYVVIGGTDYAGWTLDGYVMPRLGSGLIASAEIDLSHPVMKQIPETPKPTFEITDTHGNVLRAVDQTDWPHGQEFESELGALVMSCLYENNPDGGEGGYIPVGERIEIRRTA